MAQSQPRKRPALAACFEDRQNYITSGDDLQVNYSKSVWRAFQFVYTYSMACVLEFTNNKTEQKAYGCSKDVQWIIEKPISSFGLVRTKEEAKEHPIKDLTAAQVWADAWMRLNPGWRCKVIDIP